MSRVGKADYGHARTLFPRCAEITSEEWLRFLESEAGLTVIAKLLGDAFQVVRDDEERMTGTRKPGRRPPRYASLEEVISTVFPQRASMESFSVALEKLMRGRSLRGFLTGSDVSSSMLHYVLKGKRPLTMPIIERIAEQAKVSPGYFVEYRAMFLGELVTVLLSERPRESINYYENLMKLKRTAGK